MVTSAGDQLKFPGAKRGIDETANAEILFRNAGRERDDLRQFELRRASQRVARRDHRAKRIRNLCCKTELRIGLRVEHQPDIGGSVVQAMRHRVGSGKGEFIGDAGKSAVKRRDRAVQQIGDQTFRRHDPDVAALKTAQRFNLAPHPLDIEQKISREARQHFGGLGRRHPARQSFEQRHADHLFEPKDLPAHGDGATFKVGRCLTDRLQPIHLSEVAEER